MERLALAFGEFLHYSKDMSTAMLNFEFVTTQEAAEIIGVTDARVRQLRLSGDLRAIKIDNRTWMIPRNEAEKMAANRPKVGRPRGSGKKNP